MRLSSLIKSSRFLKIFLGDLIFLLRLGGGGGLLQRNYKNQVFKSWFPKYCITFVNFPDVNDIVKKKN